MLKRACRRGDHNWRTDGYKVAVSLPGYSGDMYLSICRDCDVMKCHSVSMLSDRWAPEQEGDN